MLLASLIIILPALVVASPAKRWTAGPEVGATTSDVFPPAGTSPNTALFPDESEVGYPGPTPTGEQPAAIETAPAYAYNNGPASSFPLVASAKTNETGFDIYKYWGNLSPWYSVPSSQYGLPDASPLAPEMCSVTQVQLLYRHGARYPTSGAPPSTFAAKIHHATEKGLTTWGELEFLNKWTYKLGAELLTPFGRSQNFELGVAFRQQYGYLLNNFTTDGRLPVFTTESQDRMVKTALNFAAGFFGVPEYLDEYNLEIVIETPGLNNTGAPYETCKNSNENSKGYQGSSAAAAFSNNAFNTTLTRLNSQVQGVEFLPTDAIAMLQLCAYETDALGYSAFCNLFTEEDFKNFEYQFSLSFYYSQGFGSPVAAAQGKGYLQQFLARLTDSPIDESDSANNKSFTDSSVYFPSNQSIYADATHEVVVLDTLTALNLTALFATGPLDLNKRTESSFSASRVVPFGTHLVVQVLECSTCSPTKQIRFIVNDAVIPIHDSYEGCGWNKDGMCAFDTVTAAWKKRIQEIDFDYDCFANYTSRLGQNYNGRAPTM